MKKIIIFVFVAFLISNIYGCLFVAGAAGGVGTAVWLGDKLTEQVNVPYDRAVNAARKGLRSLRLAIDKETKNKDVTQFLAKYTDGKQIWVDIRPVTEASSKVEVRVGVVHPDKEAADKIIKQIMRYM
jgi:uncharacterized protein YebE (UPF0316 family)